MPLNNFGVVESAMNWTLFRSAQPDADGFNTLRTLGVKTIVKLCEDKEFSDKIERDLAGSAYVALCPLPEMFRTDSLNEVRRIAGLIHDFLFNPSEPQPKLLVHCS